LANVDPLDTIGQFCDKGQSICPRFSPPTPLRKKRAGLKSRRGKEAGPESRRRRSRREAVLSGEDYHQDYYKKNPVRYKFYRTAVAAMPPAKSLGADGGHRVSLGLAAQ